MVPRLVVAVAIITLVLVLLPNSANGKRRRKRKTRNGVDLIPDRRECKCRALCVGLSAEWTSAGVELHGLVGTDLFGEVHALTDGSTINWFEEHGGARTVIWSESNSKGHLLNVQYTQNTAKKGKTRIRLRSYSLEASDSQVCNCDGCSKERLIYSDKTGDIETQYWATLTCKQDVDDGYMYYDRIAWTRLTRSSSSFTPDYDGIGGFCPGQDDSFVDADSFRSFKFSSVTNEPVNGHHPVTVCHKTGKGYNILTMDIAALPAHLAHGDHLYVEGMTCSESATLVPTSRPTHFPTLAPSFHPSKTPTVEPSASPTKLPTDAPTKSPTLAPSLHPSKAPTVEPSASPTKLPTDSPTKSPSRKPTPLPTNLPTSSPSPAPTPNPNSPTNAPTSSVPTKAPSPSPTSRAPSLAPTTSMPSVSPSLSPTTAAPTIAPTSSSPSRAPSLAPTTSMPSASPSLSPTTAAPTIAPSSSPSLAPTQAPQRDLNIFEGLAPVCECQSVCSITGDPHTYDFQGQDVWILASEVVMPMYIKDDFDVSIYSATEYAYVKSLLWGQDTYDAEVFCASKRNHEFYLSHTYDDQSTLEVYGFCKKQKGRLSSRGWYFNLDALKTNPAGDGSTESDFESTEEDSGVVIEDAGICSDAAATAGVFSPGNQKPPRGAKADPLRPVGN